MNFSLIQKYVRLGRKKTYEEKDRNPERDWRALLSTIFVFFVIAIIVAMYIYSGIEEKSDAVITGTEGARMVNVDTLYDTVMSYEGKAKELEFLKRTGIDVADPSL